MTLEQENIYHIFNQGNNHQKIFFNRENYLYFLKKINEHILPFADLLAWCLMPNHFHLIIAVRGESDRVTPSHPVTSSPVTPLNNSIATMLRSYTRAVNIQQRRSGSLFREGTKAVWLGSIANEKHKYQNRLASRAEVNKAFSDEPLQTCVRYIHNNPVKARLVSQITEWEFSSAPDIAGIRNGSLINRKLIEELGVVTG